MGYKYDLKLMFTRESLCDHESAFKDEVELTYGRISELEELITKKGTRKETNERRRLEIGELKEHIRLVNEFLK